MAQLKNQSLRIFASLSGFLIGLGLLCIIVVSLSNHVRQQHYWSDVVTPFMRYMASHQFLLSDAQLNSLSIVSSEQSNIDDLVRTRLSLGQVVFINELGLFKSYIQLGEGLLLELESDQSGRNIYEAYVWLAYVLLSAESSELDSLEHVFASWGVELTKVDDSTLLRSQTALDSLAEFGHYLVISSKDVSALVRSDSGEVYAMTFKAPFSAISWPVVILLLLGIFSALYGVVTLFVQNYERKLRAVESVAARIGRGELDARVRTKNEESGAFARLSQAFNAMADQIQRLMLVQKEMIHAVSHELRTPVARIRFGVQMIEDCPSQEALQKQVLGIDSDIQELDELIDEILTYARLEQGGPIISFDEANLFEIIEQVVDEQSVGRPNLDISSQLESSNVAWQQTEVEERYIHRSIQNLVGNATRYAKSCVKVTAHCDQDTCRVDVEDDGPGIPEDQWESVFTAFARLDDSRTRSSGGYGLGLSIVKRILHWHGGQAFLGKSQSLGGAKFSLVWPRLQRASDSDNS